MVVKEIGHKVPDAIVWGYHFDVQLPQRSVGYDLDIIFDAIMSQDGKETGEAGHRQLQSLENWRSVHG